VQTARRWIVMVAIPEDGGAVGLLPQSATGFDIGTTNRDASQTRTVHVAVIGGEQTGGGR
jgi:hypothetical protein